MPKSLMAALSDGLRNAFPASHKSQTTSIGPVSLTDPLLWRNWLGNYNFTGDTVSVDAALCLAAGSACVRLISETIATLPLGFYQRNRDGSRVDANSHDLYEILHNQPNSTQTAVVFWEIVVASMLLWGNAYIEVVRNVTGGVSALNFLHPERVTLVRRQNGTYEYQYTQYPTGKREVISIDRMMHIPAFSTDGICGLSPIAYGANVMGTAIETDRASAQTFKGALRSPGVLTMNMTLSKEQREQLRQHIRTVSDQGGVMVVENGTGFQKLGFDPVSAELLASRAWNTEEICRLFGVDPSMIGHGAKDSNWGTGLEQKMLWFVTLTLRKWCVRIEQAVRKSLLTPTERLKYFAEFALEGLLRGDSAARAQFYSTMTQNGVYTRDDCRIKENLPKMGGNAAVLTVQSNMMPLDRLGENLNPPPKPEPVPVPTPPKSDTHIHIAPPAVTINHKAGDVRVDVPEREMHFEAVIPEMKPADVKVEVHPTTLNLGDTKFAFKLDGFTALEETIRAGSENVERGISDLRAATDRPRKAVHDKDGNPIGVIAVDSLED